MQFDRKRTAMLISKLQRQTIEGEVNWSEEAPPASLVEASDERVLNFYTTRLKSHRLGLYDVRYKNWNEEGDDFIWGKEFRLGLFDEDNLLWEFPKVAGVNELAEAVKYRVANVEDVIQDLLAD